MAFKRHVPKRIDTDSSQVSHDSPEVMRRMERIENNFAVFDQMMSELEAKLPEDSPKKPKKPK